MNNSINYGNFTALLLKNNEDNTFDGVIPKDSQTSHENQPITGNTKKSQQGITSEVWLGE